MKIFSVNWEATTAGPSPDNNKRTEIFLYGCKKAKQGNECKGCFNKELQDESNCIKNYTVDEMVETIKKFSPNRYITIGGGEPTDQLEDLVPLCYELKRLGYNIIVYTWRSLKAIQNNDDEGVPCDMDLLSKLLYKIDILIDGEFHIDECIYDINSEDGLTNSVGSKNQIIWDIKNYHTNYLKGTRVFNGFKLQDILQLCIDSNQKELKYLLKDDYEEQCVQITI